MAKANSILICGMLLIIRVSDVAIASVQALVIARTEEVSLSTRKYHTESTVSTTVFAVLSCSLLDK